MNVNDAYLISSNEDAYHIAFAKLHKQLSQSIDISDESWSEIRTIFSVVRYEPKQTVFAQFHLSQYVYFCTDGFARMHYLDPDGRERNKEIIKQSSIVACLQSLLQNQPSPFGVTAITRCTFCVASITKIQELRDVNLEWEHVLLMLMQSYIINKNRREYSLLMLDAKARYIEFLREFGEQANHISLTHVAMYIGVTNVTLSRIRKELTL